MLIYGKGAKERKIQIGNDSVLCILKRYKTAFLPEMQACNHFFVKQSGVALSDQSVRRMINKYTALASIEMHITPHMFRHTFATCLLEADVDIRYIQEMLGHSSINVTEIYTHVTMSKRKIFSPENIQAAFVYSFSLINSNPKGLMSGLLFLVVVQSFGWLGKKGK